MTDVGAPRVRDVEGILEDHERSLAETIEDVLGVVPVLEVVNQSITRPPQPPWVAEMMPGVAAVLVRATRYLVGQQAVSSHVSAVDLGEIDPGLVDELRSGRTPLREVFRRIGARKFAFGNGVAAKPADLPEPLRLAFPRWAEPMVWRSYRAGRGRQPGFLIFEALPATTWERLLAYRPGPRSQSQTDSRAEGGAR